MRIVHVIDYFHTDVGYQEYYLALHQAAAGHEVAVVTSTHRHHTVSVPGADEEGGRRALEDAGVDLVRLDARQLGHDRAWLKGLRAAVLDRHPDAVHGHSCFGPTPVRLARMLPRSCRLLLDSHIQATGAPAASSPVGRAVYSAYRVAFGPTLRRAVQAFVADEPAKRAFLCERLGLPADAVDLIPLGFDPVAFGYDAGRRARARDAFGWGDEVVVATTGKLTPSKRTDALAAACDGVGVRLVVAGALDGQHEAEIRAAAPDIEIDVLPMLDRQGLGDLFHAADIVSFAGLTSISIFEAAGTGAVVLVPDDESGRWLAEQCPPSLRVGLRSLPDAIAEAGGGGDRAVRAAAADAAFSWAHIAEAFVRRYEGR